MLHITVATSYCASVGLKTPWGVPPLSCLSPIGPPSLLLYWSVPHIWSLHWYTCFISPSPYHLSDLPPLCYAGTSLISGLCADTWVLLAHPPPWPLLCQGIPAILTPTIVSIISCTFFITMLTHHTSHFHQPGWKGHCLWQQWSVHIHVPKHVICPWASPQWRGSAHSSRWSF